MERDILIGLDAGTSMLKVVAFTLGGEQIAVSGRRNRIDAADGGRVEQDMDRTWDEVVDTLRDLGDRVPDLAARVAGLAVTGQGDGTWLMDAEGRPVAPAWLWLDARSGPIIDALRRSGTGEAVYRITGTGLNTALQSGHLLWLARHRPDLLERAATAFHCKDWIYFNLTGERATDIAEGTFTFGDYRTGRYDERVLELLDLTRWRRLLPDMVDGTRHQGRLTGSAATLTGLPEGTPVILAPVDVLCTGLGAGAYHPTLDVGCTIIGSTGIHMRLFRDVSRIRRQGQAGYVMPFVVPGTWAGFMSNMAATLNIDWLLDCAEALFEMCGIAAPSRSDLLARLDRRAGEVEPGTLIYHPFIRASGERGPFVEPRARAQILGLTDGARFDDLMRAVYEGLGFAARDCYEAQNHRPTEIRLAGGAARSAVCRGVLAAAVGVPIRQVRREEAGAAGAAMVAALALGVHADMDEACARWVDGYLGPLEWPDPALTALYDGLFPIYREGYRRMFDIWSDLDRSRKRV